MSAGAAVKKSIRDWPNEAGFQALHEEHEPVELETAGSIPTYAAGVLYRTGPGNYKIERDGNKKDFICDHWFDGFGHTHRFELIAQPDGGVKVWYNSRRQEPKLIEMIQKTGSMKHVTFGQRRDPCIGLFQKVMSYFESGSTDPKMAAVCVTIHPNQAGMASTGSTKSENPGPKVVNNLWTGTDSSAMKELDPKTLEPIGYARQQKLHPQLKGPLSCAHSMTDAATGDSFNYNLELGRQAVYRVFKVSAKTGETDILATISGSDSPGAYIHSFFKTEDYLILSLWNSRFEGMGLKILTEKNLMDAMAPFNSSEKAHWFVIDRKKGNGVVAQFESHPMFAFHSVNAWQEVDSDGKLNIICDLVEYENMDILDALYYTNMTSEGKEAVNFRNTKGNTAVSTLARYKLSDIKNTTFTRTKGESVPQAEVILTGPKGEVGELPTINPRFDSKESRYIYGAVNRGYSTFFDGLSKYDTKTKEALFWDNAHGHTPGEAIFIPRPEGTEEDDGVLLSVVLDGVLGTSYLLCLDAKTMKEVGKAQCNWAVGFGFHGAAL